MPGESGEDRSADAERTRRRNRLLVVVGLLCFVVGVPLVSLPDGTALSVIGLSLETVAGACVISFIYLLAGDQHEPDSEEDELAGYVPARRISPTARRDQPGGDQNEPVGDRHERGCDGEEENEEH
jgi:hypothetical protein